MKCLLSSAFVALLLMGCRTQPKQKKPAELVSNGLAYELRGSGSTIVLIHGSNLDRRMWDGDVPWLSETHRVLRYDQSWQGASEDPVGSFSNHDDLISLLGAAGSTNAVLVGLSSGAQIAFDAALVAPERVSGLVLVSPSLQGYVPDSLPAFLTELSEALRAGEIERANQILVDSPLMSVPAESALSVRALGEDKFTVVVDSVRVGRCAQSPGHRAF